MAENKTQMTTASVTAFLDTISDEKKRRDSYTLLDLMQKASGTAPAMWGPAIVGFGEMHYIYDSGREGDMPLIGFSPRKQNLTLYVMTPGIENSESFKNLGKYSVSKSCLYIKKLDDVNMPALKKLVAEVVKGSKKMKKEMEAKKKEMTKKRKR